MAERCIIAGVAALLSFAVLFTGCEAECGFPALVEAQFGQTRTLSSLNYPQNYSNNLNCGCKITAGWNYVVHLSVTALDLEAESYCDYDSLSVYDAGSEEYNHRLAKLCGKRLNVPDIYSTGHYMYIKFKTDGSVTGQGFQLQYTAVTRPNTTTTPRPNCCGIECALSPATLTAPHFDSKLLFSPNYPQDYSNNLDCRWKITAADGRHVIRLTVNVLDLEEESTCNYDSLSVYDADSPQSSRLLAKLCGIRNDVPDMYSTGRYMYIKFITDGSTTSQGFKLQYMAVSTSTIPRPSCGLPTYLYASFGQSKTMTSPNYPLNYVNNMNCGWKITADWGFVIRLRVTVLDLEYHSRCDYDSVSVYDGVIPVLPQVDHRLAKLCGNRNNVPDIYSTGRYMYIKFVTDGSDTRQGFQLQYTAVTRQLTTTTTPRPNCCGDECVVLQELYAVLGSNRTILSPYYPQNYPNNMDCGWQITADWNYVVRLHVTALDLEEDSNCAYDSLSVYDADSEQDVYHLAKLCGRQNNLPYIYSTGRYMYIKFRTDGSETRTGFQLQYTAARHSEIVPWTTTTSALWTTTSPPSVGAVVAACSGGVVLLLVSVITVSCINWHRRRHPSSPRLITPNTNRNIRSAMTIRRQISLFLIPNSNPTSADTGHENMAYSLHSSPPPYSSLQHNANVQQPNPVAASPDTPATAPPGYEEAIRSMWWYPPSHGAPPPPINMGTGQATDAVPASPTSTSDQPEPVPRSCPDPASGTDHGATSPHDATESHPTDEVSLPDLALDITYPEEHV